ncbi:glycosyltransferase family 2 protein [Microbacterium sp. ARD31]|uniref:glycosyltransferase family 2 protein n=1 Tax=Microbacterium sp. ARD31 TaxID=2962576 RepID=UPI0028815972|nr:glycosyltransferase family 2 protein [Microbacterium sp. ARD31]MDT0182963.1 glycosyltransferase family 2 protein [Microbacterium sp. ARD31]
MITVVVVTYNSAHLLRGCLSHLSALDDEVDIVVVDNCSSDGSAQAAREAAPTAKVVERTDNGGFAVAVNEGVRHARGSSVLLLNPDAYITAGALRALAGSLSRQADVGAIAPLVTPSGPVRPTIAAGSAPTIIRMMTHMSGLSTLPLRALRGHYAQLRHVLRSSGSIDVEWVSGGCVLVRRAALESIGGLSERWFMYAEDIDMCLKLKDAGWRVALDSEVNATHETGQSSAGQDGRVSTLWLENLFDLYCVRYSPGTFRRTIWLLTTWGGFQARHLAYRHRDRYQAERFRIYASSAARLMSRRALPIRQANA